MTTNQKLASKLFRRASAEYSRESRRRLNAAAPALKAVVAELVAWNENPNENGIGLNRICRKAKKALALA